MPLWLDYVVKGFGVTFYVDSEGELLTSLFRPCYSGLCKISDCFQGGGGALRGDPTII